MIVYHNKEAQKIYYGNKRIKQAYLGSEKIFDSKNLFTAAISYGICLVCIDHQLIKYQINRPNGISGGSKFFTGKSVDMLEIFSDNNGVERFSVISDGGLYHLDGDTGEVAAQWKGDWTYANGSFALSGKELYQINPDDDTEPPSKIASNVKNCKLNYATCSYISDGVYCLYVTDGTKQEAVDFSPDLDWVSESISTNPNSYTVKLTSSNGKLELYTVRESGHVLEWRSNDGVDYSGYSEISIPIRGYVSYGILNGDLLKVTVNSDYSCRIDKVFDKCQKAVYPNAIVDGIIDTFGGEYNYSVPAPPVENYYTDIAGGSQYQVFRTADNRIFFGGYTGYGVGCYELEIP